MFFAAVFFLGGEWGVGDFIWPRSLVYLFLCLVVSSDYWFIYHSYWKTLNYLHIVKRTGHIVVAVMTMIQPGEINVAVSSDLVVPVVTSTVLLPERSESSGCRLCVGFESSYDTQYEWSRYIIRFNDKKFKAGCLQTLHAIRLLKFVRDGWKTWICQRRDRTTGSELCHDYVLMALLSRLPFSMMWD